MHAPSAAARLLLGSLLVLPLSAARADCLVPYLEPTATINRAATAVLTADFNGDGKADIAGNDANAAFVAISNGSGGFPTVSDVFTGTIKGAIVASDFTGDGKTDLALAGTSTLVVIPGNGDGTFGAAIVNQLGQSPSAIAAARFDAGATLDLAVLDSFTKDFTIYTNDGTGHFTASAVRILRAVPKLVAVGDLDGNGNTDVVLSYPDDSKWDALYGHGDGTFDAPAVVRAITAPLAIRAVDLDADGFDDLVTADPYGDAFTIRNLGSGAFGDPLRYASPYFSYDVTTAELTGDGKPDVAAALQYCAPRTWTGTGLGTLDWPWHDLSANCYFEETTKAAIAAGDFDGDGRTDLVQARIGTNPTRLTVWRNHCGEGAIQIRNQTPTITLGQSAAVTATIFPSVQVSSFLGATGNSTIEESGNVLGNATFGSLSAATFNLSNLPLGDHTLVVNFAGDAQYDPLASDPFVVHVTNETTTTTVSVSPAQGKYGIFPAVTARVTSSTGDTPTGLIRFTIDGVPGPQIPSTHAPEATSGSSFSVGTHTYSAEFLGDATHPPSSSAPVTYVIEKGSPTFGVPYPQAAAGQGATLYASLDYAGSGVQRTGTVTGTLGSTTLPAHTLDGSSATTWNLGQLTPGRYELRLHYSGDGNYNPADYVSPYVVFPASGLSVDARGTADAITVRWTTQSGAFVARRKPGEPWPGGAFAFPWRVETDVTPETTYLYRVQDFSGATSDVDVAMRIGFTDDLLSAGTVIRAVHLQEVIRAANILRAAAGLPALGLTIAPGDVVSAAHIAALRTAINEARTALGAYAFPFEGTISAGAPVRARDLQELREAIR